MKIIVLYVQVFVPYLGQSSSHAHAHAQCSALHPMSNQWTSSADPATRQKTAVMMERRLIYTILHVLRSVDARRLNAVTRRTRQVDRFWAQMTTLMCSLVRVCIYRFIWAKISYSLALGDAISKCKCYCFSNTILSYFISKHISIVRYSIECVRCVLRTILMYLPDTARVQVCECFFSLFQLHYVSVARIRKSIYRHRIRIKALLN